MAGVIRVDKSFVGLRPRTTVSLTKAGLKRLNEYLAALAGVLEQARKVADAAPRRALALGSLART